MTAPNLPILDLTRQYQELKPDIDAAVQAQMSAGQFVLGGAVQTFEQNVANYLGVQHAIGVGNGSDALYLALRALNIGPGDEVITTAMSYIATSESIVRTGATPVFVDLDPRGTFNFDLGQVETHITERTKAIMPVHLFGQAVPMDELMAIAKRHKLFVIEDCAQAIGAEWNGKKVGSEGHIGCFSFFPSKNLGAYGDGGLVITNDPELDKAIRSLRVHGAAQQYFHDRPGINSRLDAIQAAILSVKLPHLDRWNSRRRQIAETYTQAFKDLPGITTPVVLPEATPVYHQYTLRIDPKIASRDEVKTQLQALGIQTMIYYPCPLHLQGTHQALGYREGDLALTEQAAKEVFSLPIFPEMSDAEITRVIEAVTQVVSRKPQLV